MKTDTTKKFESKVQALLAYAPHLSREQAIKHLLAESEWEKADKAKRRAQRRALGWR